MRNIPVWIGWIKWLSFLTYSFSLLLKVRRNQYLCGWVGGWGVGGAQWWDEMAVFPPALTLSLCSKGRQAAGCVRGRTPAVGLLHLQRLDAPNHLHSLKGMHTHAHQWMQIEFGGRTLWDCATPANETFNPSDPWNYPAQVGWWVGAWMGGRMGG